MALLENFWWLLAAPAAFWLIWRGMRRTPKVVWVLVLRVIGALFLLTRASWFVTGNVDTRYLRYQASGWPQALAGMALGAGLLIIAQRWAKVPSNAQ